MTEHDLRHHLKKELAFHKAKAEAHDSAREAHAEYAAAAKDHHDGLDDGDAHKAFMKATHKFHLAKADHHATLHALHKAHAEHLQDRLDEIDDMRSGSQPRREELAGESGADVIDSHADGGDAVRNLLDAEVEKAIWGE